MHSVAGCAKHCSLSLTTTYPPCPARCCAASPFAASAPRAWLSAEWLWQTGFNLGWAKVLWKSASIAVWPNAGKPTTPFSNAGLYRLPVAVHQLKPTCNSVNHKADANSTTLGWCRSHLLQVALRKSCPAHLLRGGQTVEMEAQFMHAREGLLAMPGCLEWAVNESNMHAVANPSHAVKNRAPVWFPEEILLPTCSAARRCASSTTLGCATNFC